MVGLDEEEEEVEEDNIKAKENPLSIDDSEYKCPMKLLEPEPQPDNANDRIAIPKTLNDPVPEAAAQVPGEECVSVFDIKKKMLDID